MINNIFNSLSQKNLTATEKLNNIATLVQYTVDNYTADDGKVYLAVYDADLDRRGVRNMSVTELDDKVNKAALGDDLMLDLLLLTNLAKISWGADDSSVTLVNNDFILFEVCYGDKVFRKIIDVED